MNLFDKVEKFDSLVGNFDSRSEGGLKSFGKIVELANKFDKLAQPVNVETFPASSGAGINAPYMPGTAPTAGYGTPKDKAEPGVQPHLVQLNAPAVKEKEAPKSTQYDPEFVKTMQQFLSNSKPLQAAIAKGQFSPLAVDGVFGQKTKNQLAYWGKVNNIPAKNINDLVSALFSTQGNATQRAASFKKGLVRLANKFETKYE